MAERPLLMFPRPEAVAPPKGGGLPLTSAPAPDRTRQAQRIQNQFESIYAEITAVPVDTDKVLVLETIGQLPGFQKIAARIPGMQWLAEIDDVLEFGDVEDLYPDANSDAQKSLDKGGMRLYLAVSNQKAIENLRGLWAKFAAGQQLPRGYGDWKNLFKYLKDIRFWNHDDMLRDSGLLQQWREDIDAGIGGIRFEIELHYRRDASRRKHAENNVKEYVTDHGGKLLSDPVVIEGIGFHAMKVRMPATEIARYLGGWEALDGTAKWLSPDHIKYCRPMSIVGEAHGDLHEQETDAAFDLIPCNDILPPVIALLDGAPLVLHIYLENRIELDDPDNYAARYNAGENRHGTAMASLICHADFNAANPNPRSLPRKIYARPILAPNRKSQYGDEEFDAGVFPEDITERAVRRLFAGSDEQDPVAKSVRVINLSVGNSKKIFQREMSPWARLLDWLSYKHHVLFVVSAGNCLMDIEMQNAATQPDSTNLLLDIIDRPENLLNNAISHQNKMQRLWRIISPAESINAITVGALNKDDCPPAHYNVNTDIMQNYCLPALYSRLGGGYRNQIKPDILVPGGKMHYHPATEQQNRFCARENYPHQGLSHAAPDGAPQFLSGKKTTSGTSCATALTCHAAGHIFEMLEALRSEHPELETQFDALLIKALLVHGASLDSLDVGKYDILKNASNKRSWKRYVSKFIGYGEANFSRVEECTENRVTVLGFGEINKGYRHVFNLPFPNNLVNASDVRLTATLAWFSPVNPFHHAFRRAKLILEIHDVGKQRQGGSDWRQVRKGTVQHEVFELKNASNAASVRISIDCKPDSGQSLDESVPYGLAITLETSDSIDIYNAIAESIATQIPAA